jgi:non-specific serine/threonine protein kinase
VATRPSTLSRSDPLHELTRREREVATLAARGLSNRQIAEALAIGERTVETHMTNVLGKLGFATRSQLIAWAFEDALSDSSAAG